MNRIHKVFFLTGFFAVFIWCGCRKKADHITVAVKALTAYNDTIYLDKLGVEDSGDKVIDSAIIKNNSQLVNWELPLGDEAVYKIRSKTFNRGSFIFISDARNISVNANFISTIYTVKGSPATNALNEFIKKRTVIAENGRKLVKVTDSLNKANAPAVAIGKVNKELKQVMLAYFNQAIDFADTVRSPAAFLQVYYTIDFGQEHERMKKFILKNAARFPKYKPVQTLLKAELATLKIYEEEYNVGDNLPTIMLPDNNGFNINTADQKGKYYLIDFWSSWCEQCLPFKEAERALLNNTSRDKLSIISVAIDNQRSDWQSIIANNRYNWPQLIDENMWKGIAVQTLKFDSIPFNFLVDPHGKIVAKALKASNLAKTVASEVK